MMGTNYLKMKLQKNSGQNLIERLNAWHEKERKEELIEKIKRINDK